MSDTSTEAKPAYVVLASIGEYEDMETYPVAVHLSRDGAEDHAKLAQEAADALLENRRKPRELRVLKNPSNPWDRWWKHEPKLPATYCVEATWFHGEAGYAVPMHSAPEER